jgi:hypothetical protein
MGLHWYLRELTLGLLMPHTVCRYTGLTPRHTETT